MQISIVCQPGADATHWCALYLKGAPVRGIRARLADD